MNVQTLDPEPLKETEERRSMIMKRIDIRRILGTMVSTGGLTLAACTRANTTQGGPGSGMMGGGQGNGRMGGYGNGWMGGGYGGPWMMVLVVAVIVGLVVWIVARGRNKN